MIKKPVYTMDVAWARSHNELDDWRESRRLNEECAGIIDETIKRNYDGWRLKQDAVKEAVDACGLDRVEFVLAATVQDHSYDGRYSKRNKNWAMSFWIPNGSFSCSRTHPAILDGFIDQLLRIEAETA